MDSGRHLHLLQTKVLSNYYTYQLLNYNNNMFYPTTQLLIHSRNRSTSRVGDSEQPFCFRLCQRLCSQGDSFIQPSEDVKPDDKAQSGPPSGFHSAHPISGQFIVDNNEALIWVRDRRLLFVDVVAKYLTRSQRQGVGPLRHLFITGINLA
ncbi:hypothetical protein CEXT_814491 [Caerostris extrusa]|uniref:Uncharacterized protein n=1 Tax=Caerostris extrusa TaxID=172846 RepID=A0AAV4N9S2_CAEEX|nr:hypothetical protein CEXT_814491 [Caerostris extrusa]